MAKFQALPGFAKMLVSQLHTIADAYTAPGRFILCQHDNGTFFTAWQNLQDGGMFYSHYDLSEHAARQDLLNRFRGTTWERMNDRIKPGAIIDITRNGRTISGKVTRVCNYPNTSHQGGFWDIEYDVIFNEDSSHAIGRWKQQTDGGTVKIIKDAS